MSLELGAILVAAASIVLVILTNKLPSFMARVALLAAFTYVFSCVFYWSPVWFGPSTGEQYSSWAPLVIHVWFGAGFISGLVVMAGFRLVTAYKSRLSKKLIKTEDIE